MQTTPGITVCLTVKERVRNCMFVTYVPVSITKCLELLVRAFYIGIKSAVSSVQDKGCSSI